MNTHIYTKSYVKYQHLGINTLKMAQHFGTAASGQIKQQFFTTTHSDSRRFEIRMRIQIFFS